MTLPTPHLFVADVATILSIELKELTEIRR